MTKRNITIDIIKGVSIAAIVFGHAFNTDTFYSPSVDYLRRFVYLFHLVTFFFASGYTFKNYDVKTFLKKKINGLYIPFIIIQLLSLTLYPIWRYFNVINQIKPISLIKTAIQILLFLPSGIFVGAMWFVPSLFIALFLYYVIYNLKIHQKFKLLIIILFSLIGYVLVWKGIGLPTINRGLLMMIFISLGHITNEKEWLNYIKPKHILILLPVMIFINVFKYFEIEISKGLLSSGWFFIISLIGILFCTSLSKLIEKSSSVSKLFTNLSAQSFYIMSFHFIVFKSFDIIYSLTVNDYSNIQAYPISYPSFRIVYFILGLFISIILGKAIHPVISKIKIS